MKGWTVKDLTRWVLGLTILDVGSTYAGLKIGTVVEMNPLLGSFMTSFPLLTSALTVMFVWSLLTVLNKVKHPWIFDLLGLVFFAKLGVMVLHINGMVRSVI